MKDIVVIGGGIVGLATAYQILKNSKAKVIVLEKESHPAAHQTSHNSGVIHSGIYYKPGSLKAKNCISGYNTLLEFCRENDIAYDLCGKIIVATEEAEKPQLEVLWNRGLENGLNGLKKISQAELKEIEPHVSGLEGIYVPQTGIIEFKKVAEKLVEKIHSLGGDVRFNSEVIEIVDNHAKKIEVHTKSFKLEADVLVNCAGLFCDRIARNLGHNSDLKIIPFRGEYWELIPEKEYLVKNLIYPVPNPNFPFLGVHFTRMMKGGVELGPNAVLAFRREGYKKSDINLFDLYDSLTWPGFHTVVKKYWKDGFFEMYRSFSKSAFLKSAQKLVPDLVIDDLVTGGSGVRAQACSKDGRLIDDFMIVQKNNFIHVLNAPSPAATSSLSIGHTIGQTVSQQLY